ncbi:MAG: PilZ domain-containing protein [Deltaproteobacteria bacterium]|nr:PilZ domain-containing protein [Deltaproteobacteria bacterium]MBW1736144.1 PilZ domain-containing protein [Deltaproteobacteria bacterium]MBW1908472.1 PilZ domain-containing protein [Deltaproteobacteria bacterium]MBW2032523.1 PilZ domain-containing protein [Deltaproteobacteria bacterium]MBW2113450.1 PilZ domain-containing protein [Deltaproteobacteria bacterium]
MSKNQVDQLERRRHPRLKSLWLISYVGKEGGVQKSPISITRTLDMSPVGVKLETIEPLDPNALLEMEIAIKERIFSVHGQVVYCREIPAANYIVGIQFDQPVEEIIKTLSDDLVEASP